MVTVSVAPLIRFVLPTLTFMVPGRTRKRIIILLVSLRLGLLKCPKCDAQFASESDLKAHLRGVHGDS